MFKSFPTEVPNRGEQVDIIHKGRNRKNTPPEPRITWNAENQPFKMNPIDKISFDIGNGLYDFEKIQQYRVLTVFSGAENQLTATLTKPATNNRDNQNFKADKMTVKTLFPQYPCDSIKKMVVNKFIMFGNVCSILVGIFTTINFIKMIISTSMNCIMLRRVGAGLQDICKFTVSTSTFLLKKIPEYHLERKIWKPVSNNTPKENLLQLKKLNEQKLGPI